MTTQLIISTFILTYCFTGCRQENSENKNRETQVNQIQIEAPVYAIFPFDTGLKDIFGNGKRAELTTDDLSKIDTILKKSVDEYNFEQEVQFRKMNDKHPEYELDRKNFIINLISYKRQYVALINSKGEKEVWINCFCDARDKNWMKILIYAEDGGNCYFNLRVNLTTGEYYEFMVNGNA